MHDFFARPASSAYLEAKAAVVSAGYEWEIEWQQNASREPLSERRLMREFAWVVLSAGLRESTVRTVFPAVTAAFGDWHSADHIWRTRHTCRRDALIVFNSPRKIDAIIVAAGYLRNIGEEKFCSRATDADGIDFLMRLPFLGPATARHFAKNLGVNIAKPDRHLMRLAESIGTSVPVLCGTISEVVGDPISVVDVVLWRFASMTNTAAATFFQMCLDHVEPSRPQTGVGS